MRCHFILQHKAKEVSEFVHVNISTRKTRTHTRLHSFVLGTDAPKGEAIVAMHTLPSAPTCQAVPLQAKP